MTRVVALMLLVLASACGARRSTAARWAQPDLECDDLRVTQITLHHFEVFGCGLTALYHCPNADACEREGSVVGRADASGDTSGDTSSDTAGDESPTTAESDAAQGPTHSRPEEAATHLSSPTP